MRQKRTHKFNGVSYEIIQPNIGKGGQGTVHKARRKDGHSQLAIVKEIPYTTDQHKRITALIDSGLGYEQPFVSAPLAVNYSRRGNKLFYLATYCDGVSLENDPPRNFPQLLETATTLCHIWAGLEKRGIAHGDISFTNIMVDDGKPEIIDIDNYHSTQMNVPNPTKRGQHPVMAPELRGNNKNTQICPPDIYSDRFAWSNVFNFLVLGRHCCDGLVNDTPAQFNQLMSRGTWPEFLRQPERGETPIQALGKPLTNLFEKSFAIRPHERPSAQDWKQGFSEALEQMYVHKCGGVFIVDPNQLQCPYCHEKVNINQIPKGTHQLIFRHIDSGVVSEFNLVDGQYLYIGRNNLKNASSYISSKQLRVVKQGNKLYLAHVGKNPTRITLSSTIQTYQLKTGEIRIDDPRLNGAMFQLADCPFEIEVKK